ncbi:MAG TPA: AMP-binding protein, partial [Nevskiaceae bacterium]|nr:AMP-binding protein [Nevskiaceae bacterium]
MTGQMMELPLLISSLIAHADRYHGDTEIVSRTIEGPIHRTNYREAHRRARKLATALQKLGVQPGQRVATLAWNGYRHFEAYYAISGIGAVIHTINPRLHPEQIAWIAGHAEDQYLFFDITFAPAVEKMAAECKTVKGWIAMTDRAHMPDIKVKNLLCYEELVESAAEIAAWPQFDERAPACLCYTSGTTGNPKGVQYSHRSTLLHTYASAQADVFGLNGRDTILPVVPMFHVNAWAIPYSAAMCGARIVFPGSQLDGASIVELFETEKVTFSAGVPTVWLGVL